MVCVGPRRGKQRIDTIAVIGRASLGESTRRVIGDVVAGVGDCSRAIEAIASQDGALEARRRGFPGRVPCL
jgi:hypothetical protein